MLSWLIPFALVAGDKALDNWSRAAAGPGTRYAHTLVWDGVAKRALLFGGERNTDDGKAEAILDDLWLYDPASDARAAAC